MTTSHSEPFVGLAWRSHKARPWLFDMEAIREAAALLGLKHPVLVAVSDTTRLSGSHRTKGPISARGERFDFHHQITVGRTLSFREASATIWHELTHAMQRERDGESFEVQYRQESIEAGYQGNRYEREARAMEVMAEDLDLVKETNHA
jgi:hypothetical protein